MSGASLKTSIYLLANQDYTFHLIRMFGCESDVTSWRYWEDPRKIAGPPDYFQRPVECNGVARLITNIPNNETWGERYKFKPDDPLSCVTSTTEIFAALTHKKTSAVDWSLWQPKELQRLSLPTTIHQQGFSYELVKVQDSSINTNLIIFWTANDVTRRIVVFLRNTLRQVARWSSKESWETPDRRAPGAERFLGISRQPMKRQAAIAHTVWHTQSNALPEPCQAWLQTG